MHRQKKSYCQGFLGGSMKGKLETEVPTKTLSRSLRGKKKRERRRTVNGFAVARGLERHKGGIQRGKPVR